MTLSGKSDGQERLEAARRARQNRAAVSHARRPWLIRLITAIAIIVLTGAVGYAILSGIPFF